MTTATAGQTVRVTKTGDFRIDAIEQNGNFRMAYNQGQMQELADNVKKVGVLQSILLREKSPGKYVLIAGARRLRAAKMAGLKVIPARVMDVTEEQAAELQALENLHRADLNPMEEAKAFQTLTDQGGWSVEELAKRIDKSKVYVYQAIRLLDLCKEAQEAIAQGKMRPTSGHRLLTVTVELQKQFTKEIVKGQILTLAQLERQIDQAVGRDLSKASWPMDKEYAGKGACSTCSFNSGNQGLLFAGEKKGRCTNAECYDVKHGAFVASMADKIAEKLKVKVAGNVRLNYDGSVEEGQGGAKGAFKVDVNDAKVKKAIAEHPEKFAAAGVPARWDSEKDSAVVLCLDAKVLPERKTETNYEAQGKKERARQKREKAIQSEMYQMIKAELPSVANVGMWAAIVRALDKSYAARGIWDAYGIPKKGSVAVEDKELIRRTTSELMQVAFLLALQGFTDYGGKAHPEFAELGIKIGDVRAQAMKQIAEASKGKAKK